MHWGSYGWGMGLGWLYMVAFWVVIITAVIYFVKFIERKLDAGVRRETPIETIKDRYAKGEITREEFGRMKEDLNKS